MNVTFKGAQNCGYASLLLYKESGFYPPILRASFKEHNKGKDITDYDQAWRKVFFELTDEDLTVFKKNAKDNPIQEGDNFVRFDVVSFNHVDLAKKKDIKDTRVNREFFLNGKPLEVKKENMPVFDFIYKLFDKLSKKNTDYFKVTQDYFTSDSVVKNIYSNIAPDPVLNKKGLLDGSKISDYHEVLIFKKNLVIAKRKIMKSMMNYMMNLHL